MGGSHHLKRLPAPVYWPIHKKESQWTVKPKPGTHPVGRCFPLLLVLRDVLGLAKTKREAKSLISEKQIKVDGRFVPEYDFPVGIMDVIEIPKMDKAYRVLPSSHAILTLHGIDGKERSFKLCKIVGKTSIKGGRLQLNLHDGRSILIKRPEETKQRYDTSDVLRVSLPKAKILGQVKLRKGVPAIVTGGKNIGIVGKVSEIKEEKEGQQKIVTLDSAGGQKLKTIIEYAFAVGEEEPWISLPEGS